MASSTPIFSLLIITTLFSVTKSTPTIGITIKNYPPSLSPEKLASTISRQNITAVRLIDPDPSIIRAFSYSSISLIITIPNSMVHSLSTNHSNAALYLYSRVIPFYPRANITSISVGSDPLSSTVDLSDHLLPAIRNVHVALRQLGIRKIKVSTTFSLINIITSPFPPSSCEFSEPINDLIIRPLLDFLQEESSFFMVDLYPFDLYRLNHEIPLGFALFQESPFNFRDDSTTGVRYRNIFDMMVDAVLSAMVVSGHDNVPVIVAETGWPGGDTGGEESDANLVFAEMYLRGLIDHIRFGGGTPLKKDGVSEVYIFELFDKEIVANQESDGDDFPAKQWGILYPNLTSKYKLEFNGGCSKSVGFNGFLMDLGVVSIVVVLLCQRFLMMLYLELV